MHSKISYFIINVDRFIQLDKFAMQVSASDEIWGL